MITMNIENNDESSNNSNNPEFNYNNNYYGAEKELYEQMINQLKEEIICLRQQLAQALSKS